MAYTSRKRPAEYASKSSHSHLIQDSAVQGFLSNCDIPKPVDDIAIPLDRQFIFTPFKYNPIQQVIAIDGGYEEIPVRSEFPSSTVCFFQFGVLVFSISDLESLEYKPFIDPEDIAKLKQIQRFKLTLPIRNVRLKSQPTITHSVRRALYDFFMEKLEDSDSLMDTLRWFIFHEYASPVPEWTLSSCPNCNTTRIPLQRATITNTFTFSCNACQGQLYLTDVFRLHEAIDDEIGAGGILGYVTTTIEQILLVHMIRLLLKLKPALLKEFLFIKDGPLAFFGQTANMHRPMRDLVTFLFNHHNIYLAGLEKSGAFVEHADQINKIIPEGTVILLNDEYIYKYILPASSPDPSNIFGRSTYYSSKLIFKAPSGGMHVVTLPTLEALANPTEAEYRHLDVILTNLDKLKCDMYDNALLPVALVNRLVSLAQHPSSKILQRFAVTTMNK